MQTTTRLVGALLGLVFFLSVGANSVKAEPPMIVPGAEPVSPSPAVASEAGKKSANPGSAGEPESAKPDNAKSASAESQGIEPDQSGPDTTKSDKAATATAELKPASSQSGASEQWGEDKRPEGYVKTKAPKKGSQSYNWKQMAYASLVMLFMVAFIAWLVRKNTRD